MTERQRIGERMRTLTATTALILATGAAWAQAPEPAAAPAAQADAEASGTLGGTTDAGFEPGFETGLRLGVTAPLGQAGDAATGGDVELKDLAPLRVPVWIDVGYRLSEHTTLGFYGQIGFGSTGGSCGDDCDWSDLRVGIQGQWRFTGVAASTKPWLGLGLGYESISLRSLLPPMGGVPIRAAQKLGGPELTIQLGLDFRVEDALDVGPYLSGTLGQYMFDRLTCDPVRCAGDQLIDAAGFHSWLGVGLRGTYLP